jgi:Ribosomal RNA adenine dimethylase
MPSLLREFRIWFYNFRLKCYHDSLKRGMARFKAQSKISDVELSQALTYFEFKPITVFPYEFTSKYIDLNVDVHMEEGIPYIKFDEGKKLYFKSHWSQSQIIHYARSILAEQDVESPHLYLSNGFDVEPDDTVIDIGVAEGNFSLSVIDRVKKVLVFEYDMGWIQALKETFQPYGEKVTIHCKKVSNISSKFSVALDDLQELKNVKLFIKIDVDGEEKKVLMGMKNLLTSNTQVKVAICTYHRRNDASSFELFLKNLGYKTSFSKGYMLFHFDKNSNSPPFLRKGVLRGIKQL